MKNKKIVVFVIDHLVVGGIETYIYEVSKRLKKEGVQIVWAKKAKARIDDSFTSEFLDGKTILCNGLDKKKIKGLVEGYDAEIEIITFDMFKFAKAEAFKKKFKYCPVHTFYFVPHFKGDALYLQDGFSGKKKEKVRQRAEAIIKKMHANGNIKYFSKKHVERMTGDYSYEVENITASLVPIRNKEMVDFDRDRCESLYKREIFNILTVSRFELPHKGYIVGLIDTFAKLKKNHPQLKLTIVGYGPDEGKLRSQVDKLDKEVSCDISFEGKVSPEKLVEYYNDANLNISVAGCCSQGAKNGTLSIPARHYTYDCEVYGFLPESKPFTVSDEPGESVEGYIEKVLNMSLEEYCDKCKASYDTFNDSEQMLRRDFFEIKNNSTKTLLNDEIKYIARKHRQHKAREYKRIFSTEGLIKPILRRLGRYVKGK